MVGAVVVIAANDIKGCMSAECTHLAIIPAEDVESGSYRSMPQAVRPRLDVGPLAELITDQVIDAQTGDPAVALDFLQTDEQWCVRSCGHYAI